MDTTGFLVQVHCSSLNVEEVFEVNFVGEINIFQNSTNEVSAGANAPVAPPLDPPMLALLKYS